MFGNCFYRIMDWPYHPRVIITLGFLVSLYTSMSYGDAPLWAGLIASAIVMPFIPIFLFSPYLLTVVVLAAMYSLLRAIRFKHAAHTG